MTPTSLPALGFRDDCACVECGMHAGDRDRMKADLAAARAEIAAMAKGTSHDCDIIADGADTEEQLRADLMGQRDAYSLLADDLTAERIEVARLRGEVANRNQRALDGDNAVAAISGVMDTLDKAEATLAAERIEIAHLREAFVTMERAANQHETERDRALADLDDAATAINEAMDILGLAGIDQPITVVDAARSRMDDLAAARAEELATHRALDATLEYLRDVKADLAAARAVLDSAEPYGVWPDLNSPHGFLRVDSAKWQAWQGRKR